VGLRFGVIGAGWVATARHIPSIQRLADVELVAVFDRSLDRAKAAAPKGVLATGDLDEFYGSDLDAVSICTSPWSHADQAIGALGRGVNVLCEKPMALNSAEANSMAQAAETAQRTLCISHNFLWSDAMNKARRSLSKAGPLRYVTGFQLSSEERRLPVWYQDLPGGLLFDEIPHMLYILDDLLGSDLVVEDVRTDWAGRANEPQSCEIWLRGKRGPGQLTMVFGAPISEWHVASVAEKTVVDVDLFRDVTISSGSDGAHGARDVLATSARVATKHLAGFAASGIRLARRRQYWGHDGLIEAFSNSIQERTPSPVPISSALAVVRCSDAILEAILPK
jgi:predicted dehydrogenase